MADRNLRIRMLLEAGDKITRPLRDIANGSTRAAQALKLTRDKLKEIERAKADVGGFRELKAGLRTTEQAMQAAQTKVGRLAQEIEQTATPTRAMTREFERAKREEQQLTRQHDLDGRALQELSLRLHAAGVDVNDLAGHERRLTAAIAVSTAVPAMATGMPAGGPSNATRASAPLAAPAPITIKVYGAPGQSAEDIAKAVRDALVDYQREQAATVKI